VSNAARRLMDSEECYARLLASREFVEEALGQYPARLYQAYKANDPINLQREMQKMVDEYANDCIVDANDLERLVEQFEKYDRMRARK
jgi:hypothetical protein